MKPSRFMEGQIIAILREQKTSAKTADICRSHGSRSATLLDGGLEVVTRGSEVA